MSIITGSKFMASHSYLILMHYLCSTFGKLAQNIGKLMGSI